MAVQYKDYYQVLGIAKNAPQDEVRKAFRKLARLHHPDVAKDKKAAESKFKEINEAYEVLGDPEKRRQYDELGANWNQRSQQASSGAGNGHGGFASGMDQQQFSDFFEAFFGGAGGGGRAGARQRGSSFFGGGAPQSRDSEAEVQVTVEDLIQGARKRVSVRRPPNGAVERMDVRVPAGVVPGQKIRLAGKGQNGGDLFLRVVLLPHAAYKVEGADLVREVHVHAWQAVLGGEVQVATPEGTVRLKVPGASQPGRRFRIPGRGLPSGKGERGDFYVQLQVSIPQSLTLEERAAWVKLQEISGS